MKFVKGLKGNTKMQYFSIEITDLAEKDLEDIGDYIAYELQNPQAALNTLRGIRSVINQLDLFPERNEVDEDEQLAKLGLYKEYYKNYKIYYLIDKDKSKVIIVRILHMLVDSRVWLYRTFNLE